MSILAGDEEYGDEVTSGLLNEDDRVILAGLGFDPDYVEVVEDNSAACQPATMRQVPA